VGTTAAIRPDPGSAPARALRETAAGLSTELGFLRPEQRRTA
jgi:hypothetical protein